jgi:hypothetical protein
MDLGGVIAAICAFSVVCLGSVALLAFVVLRLAGRSVGSIIGDITGGNEEELPPTPVRRQQRFAPKRGGGSFDEALQRHAQQSGKQPPQQGGFERRIPDASASDASANIGSGLGEIDPDLRSLRGRSAGSKKRRDGYEIYDDEMGDAGDVMDFFG